MTVPPALLSHESTEHYTPQYILDAVIVCMGAIDVDPCSNSNEIPNVPAAARHYTIQDNGLVQSWEGRVFINPPFGPGVEIWFSKLYQERLAGRTTEAIVLWKSATETAAWKTLTKLSCRVCFPSVRIRFAGAAGEERTGPKFSPELFYVGGRPERFETTFDGISAIITGADVAKNDFSLSPSRYVAQNGRDEPLPLEDAVVLLKEAEEERREADEQLKKVLGVLGLDLDR